VARSEHDALNAAWASLAFSKALVSNVAGEALSALLLSKLQQRGIRDSAVRWFRAQPECAGVKNNYAQPAQLGSDRFASLIGARYRFPGERLLVVTCGTATTIDALEADGRFIGGMIVPGLGTMANSLAINTALLPAVEAAGRERVFADNTQEAIISGCLAAQVGAIAQAMAQRHNPTARCVISGGAAPYIVPHLPFPADAVDNLVLLGLHASVAGAS
jgi:type III pantothenate kinase